MSDILKVSGLCKSYEEFALKDVSFSVPRGYVMGFVGPNGAGKTTTIKSILGMTHYSQGEITALGLDAKAQHSKICEEIGVVMDDTFYSADWTAKDVGDVMRLFYKQWNGEEYKKWLERFSLSEKKKIKELSRGMKMKLMLAAAFSHGAQLLILDEPTSGLDPVARDELLDILWDFIADENKGVLFSTHITSDLEKIADYITFIIKGEIAYTGPKEELLEKYILVKGSREALTPELRSKAIGLREHSAGFEGMIECAQREFAGEGLIFEPVSLEQIIVFMNKGEVA